MAVNEDTMSRSRQGVNSIGQNNIGQIFGPKPGQNLVYPFQFDFSGKFSGKILGKNVLLLNGPPDHRDYVLVFPES